MAAPHTTGEIALLLSARPALIGDFDGIANAVRATALDRIDTTCGAAPGGDPNNVYGDGRIDAAAAVELVKTGGTWSYDELNKFLYDPKAYAAGTKMTFAGLKKDAERANVIAYLRSLSDSPAPLP